MRQAILVTLTVLIAVVSHVAGVMGQEPAVAPDSPIDFKRDIRPIFRRHCLSCHGAEKQEGGLRLDDREHAQKGGASQALILGPTLETNAIYQRVTTTDLESRMPINRPPLSPREISTIERWVKQMTPWPASTIQIPPEATRPAMIDPDATLWERFGSFADDVADVFTEYPFLKDLAYIALALLLLALLCEVCRTSIKKQRRWTTGKLRPIAALAGRMRLSHFLVLLLAATLVLGWRDSRSRLDAANVEKKKLQQQILIISPNTAPVTETIYGSPPIPNRPSKLKEISGTYYRGNCERNAKLFNGGNYRTATFHLGLVGPDKKQIELGSVVKGLPLSIRFEIERAPKTAPEFFTKNTTDRIFLTEHHADYPPAKEPTSEPVVLETIEDEQRWGGFYPIGAVTDDGKTTMSGLIYVVVGSQKDDAVTGQIHYGIKYDLVFENGKIIDGSDIWMGELFVSVAVAPPRKDKVPLVEWFDYRPIPEITGENTKDPKLLGIEQFKKESNESPSSETKSNEEVSTPAKSDAARPDDTSAK